MTLEQVKYLRQLYDDNILIFADNAKFFNVNAEKTHIIWDDTREVVHAIRTNTNYYTQSKNPIQVESFPYEMIQYIGTTDSKEDLIAFLNKLKTDNLVTDEVIANIIDDMTSKKKKEDNKK